MNDAEKKFKHELEVFDKDVTKCTKFIYVYLTIEYLKDTNNIILEKLNETPKFWFTIIDAMQHSFFITLGRIFDNSKCNIKTLFNTAKNKKEFPQYTRPENLKIKSKNYKVPKILLSGNHQEVEKWRKNN